MGIREVESGEERWKEEWLGKDEEDKESEGTERGRKEVGKGRKV